MTDRPHNILLVGSREFSKYVLRHLVGANYDVALVIEPESSSQSGHASMSAVCERNGIPLERTDDINSEEIRSTIERVNPDIGLCLGWTDIIRDRVLELPSQGFLGIHASDLPRGRGGAPVNWQIINGHDQVDVSLFELVSEVDDGDVYAKASVPVRDRDDVATVYSSITAAAFDLLDDVLPRLARGDADPRQQSVAQATYWPARKPADGIIDWGRSPDEQWRWIRALTEPYPGAFTFYGGRRVVVWDASPRAEQVDSEDGQIVRIAPGDGVDVATGEGVIRLERLQFGEGPTLWADEAATRFGLEPGDKFGTEADFPEWLYTGIRDGDGGFEYDTNLDPGATARFTVIGCSLPDPVRATVVVLVDGEERREFTMDIDGWTATDVDVGPLTEGIHGFQVDFAAGDYSDRRYCKIYVAE